MIDSLIEYGVIAAVKSHISYSHRNEYSITGNVEEIYCTYQSRLTDVLEGRNVKKVVRLMVMQEICELYFKAFEDSLDGERITFMIEYGVPKFVKRYSRMRTVPCDYCLGHKVANTVEDLTEIFEIQLREALKQSGKFWS